MGYFPYKIQIRSGSISNLFQLIDIDKKTCEESEMLPYLHANKVS